MTPGIGVPVELTSVDDPNRFQAVVTGTVTQRAEVRVSADMESAAIQDLIARELVRQGDLAYGAGIRAETVELVTTLTAERDRLTVELDRAQRVIDALTRADTVTDRHEHRPQRTLTGYGCAACGADLTVKP